MATTTSVSPTAVERSGSRRGQSQSTVTRSQSTRTRTTAVTTSPQRANSSRHHRTSSRQGAVEEFLPQANYETANVAQASRRSTSRENGHPSRTESTRSTSGHHRHSHSRYSSDMATTVANGGGPAPVVVATETRNANGRSGKSRTTIPAQSGNWVLGKTIGAGSMGKVKLARRVEGGEQVAVKIVPRGSTDDGGHQSRADRERADHSKEVRTAREAAIVTLLDHPYICGMRDVVRTTYHWYMLFEFVNGGQMLDYIISHGRLKEKQARKFSRQIASALDYCHRNSIVHRDLKIENILISKTGDIKIIDFGLSNLFSPRNHLKTFCGSLYFAAPELLQARAYTGPEVDVWSFGIVLYVLVCGKVPFDDQSMPALHAKIKKGIVDYPNWLSPECKNLISRMLVTDPKQRATLQEIMCHPWMIKGFGSPPENYLPLREPLQLPLDPAVIHAMTGFDFGPPEVIHAQLTEVLESEQYQRAIRLALHEREREAQLPKDPEKKRSFGFDFYKRRNSISSRDTLTTPSTEGLQLGNDPINAYHPLISVYFLVKEKQERDRLAANPGATSMPRSPNEAPLQLPEINAPKAAYTNAGTYEMPGENATGGRSRPRARTHGEDEITDNMKHVKLGTASGPTSPAIIEPHPELPRKESTAAGLLRRFSTRRKPEKSQPPPLIAVQSSNEQSSLRKSFSMRRSREREPARSPSHLRSGSSQPQHSDLLSPPRTADTSHSSKGLGRSTSVNSAEYRRRSDRRGGSDASPRVTYKEPPPTSGSDHSTSNDRAGPESENRGHHSPRSTSARAKSLGHARRESIQARRARRDEAREADVPEEVDFEQAEASGISTDRVDTTDIAKPVFLKGLFSVSTTSTKPVQTIRQDIIRVLKQLGVDYREIRGGFSCRHSPSIDLKKVVDLPPSAGHSSQTPSHKRRISFGGFMAGNAEKDRDDFRDTEKPSHAPKTPRRTGGDASYTDSDVSDESDNRDRHGSSGRAVGETSTHVQSELGGSLVLEFEIFIVKVPLLSLHGIQFKRLAGGTWQRGAATSPTTNNIEPRLHCELQANCLRPQSKLFGQRLDKIYQRQEVCLETARESFDHTLLGVASRDKSSQHNYIYQLSSLLGLQRPSFTMLQGAHVYSHQHQYNPPGEASWMHHQGHHQHAQQAAAAAASVAQQQHYNRIAATHNSSAPSLASSHVQESAIMDNVTEENRRTLAFIADLLNEETREAALLELSKKREQVPELALILWHSFGVMTSLLQEIISVYTLLNPSQLTAAASNRVCNALALLQCVASHNETRALFLNAHIPLFLYPFLNTTSKSRPFEYLRLTSLGVIGALVKNDSSDVINFLLTTEIIPLCLRIMETGSELSKTVAIFIVQKILLDDHGLNYICATYERFYAVGTVLSNMVSQLVEQQTARLLKHVVRCFLRLSDNARAREALRQCLPEPLRDATFSSVLRDDAATKRCLAQLLINLSDNVVESSGAHHPGL
ncbi:hypothetical protein B7463_g45, partial [Scytalidium lignicola]